MYEKSGNLLCEKLQFVESNRFYHIKLSNDIEYSNKNTLRRFGRSKKGNNNWINFPLLIEHYIELKTAHTHLIIITHVHSTVKHDILPTNSNKDTATSNIFKINNNIAQLSNNIDGLCTSVYHKPTDSHSYLLYSSSHPSHI